MQINWLARPDGDPRVVKPYYLLTHHLEPVLGLIENIVNNKSVRG
jgi:hypothetical protein